MEVKFTHTNIVARDYQELARFYTRVFGCESVLPERNLSGEWVEQLTGINGVHIRGIHLRLPGYSNGPTLEIFQFNREIESDDMPAINSPGLAHIAFQVDDVEFYLQRLLTSGGHRLGATVRKVIEGVGLLTVVYARDPEGNIVEIQSWE